jgi:hypothetical protein
MLSPRSRGKGSRRVPWRDGGRRKRKPVTWRKQATHAVDDPSELSGELVWDYYQCPSGRSPHQGIYLFDQEAARAGIRYYAELSGSRFYPAFFIHVPVADKDKVTAIIARLENRIQR